MAVRSDEAWLEVWLTDDLEAVKPAFKAIVK